MTSHARRRNRKGEGELLRRDVLDATAGLLAEIGDATAVSVRQIAAAAGVTPPALYRLFPDKEALLREVVAERFAAFDRYLDAVAGDADGPFDDLRRRCHGYLAYAAEHPGHYRLLFSATHLGPVAVGRAGGGHPGARSFFRLAEIIHACLDAGDRTDQVANLVAVEVWAVLHGLADLRITKPEFPWPPGPSLIDDLLVRLGLRRDCADQRKDSGANHSEDERPERRIGEAPLAP